MAHSVVVGIQRPDGSRIDIPDPQGNPRPVMLRLGPGLSGAADWPTAGETQVMIQAPTQLHLSGGGLEHSVPVKSITLGDTFSATNYSYTGESLTLNALSALTFSGEGITGTVRPNHIILGSGMTGWYTGGNLYLYATTGGGGGVPIGDPNSVLASNGTSNFWDDFPTVNGVSTITAVIRPESTGQNHTIRQSGDKLVDYTSSIGGTVGSYAISAKPYDNSSSAAPRHTKFNGSFSLVGQNVVKVLQFPSAIDGASMPANSTLVGKFMIGWKGIRGGNPYVAGAFEFMFTVTTDASGNLYRFRTALNPNEATPSTPYTFSLDSTSLDTSMSVMNGHLPCAISIAIYGSEFWLEFGTYEGPVVQSTDVSKFYWECSYGWGTT